MKPSVANIDMKSLYEKELNDRPFIIIIIIIIPTSTADSG